MGGEGFHVWSERYEINQFRGVSKILIPDRLSMRIVCKIMSKAALSPEGFNLLVTHLVSFFRTFCHLLVKKYCKHFDSTGSRAAIVLVKRGGTT